MPGILFSHMSVYSISEQNIMLLLKSRLHNFHLFLLILPVSSIQEKVTLS